MNLVEFRNVSFRYDEEHPLICEQINVHFLSGETAVILGPNGAGKTTLLKMILGWLRPQAGTVIVGERDIGSYSGRERGRLMSLVPQSEHIPFEYSLIEYVLLGRIPYMKPLELPAKEQIGIARTSLERVGLDPDDSRPITILSGGERQLLMLARSLCQAPKLLILDEPTSHLDLANKKRLAEILSGLRTRGLTIILTTHEPDFAAAAADKLTLMNKNGIVASGEFSAVCTEDNLKETYGTDLTTKTVEGKRTIFWW